MGHIRLGRLPKTKSWSCIFDALADYGISGGQLADTAALAAQRQFIRLQDDKGINLCFWILVRVAAAARSQDFLRAIEQLGIEGSAASTGLRFVQQVSRIVGEGLQKRGEPSVFARMAELSLREVLSRCIADQSRSLFGSGLAEVQAACRAMSTRKEFALVARQFFASFFSRSLRYITDKEASNFVGTDKPIGSPEHLKRLYDDIDRYCVESSRILEEFAGGLFSKHSWETNNDIPEDAAAGFTAYALEKIRMELQEAQK